MKKIILFIVAVFMFTCSSETEYVLYEKEISKDHDDWRVFNDTIKKTFTLGSSSLELPVEVIFTKALDPDGCNRFAYIKLQSRNDHHFESSDFETEFAPCGTKQDGEQHVMFETVVVSGELEGKINGKEHTVKGKLVTITTLGDIVTH